MSDLDNEIRHIHSVMKNKIRKQEFKDIVIKESYIFNDMEAKEDLLNMDIYVKSFKNLILNKQTIAPLNIGVFGDWGKGKSTFLKLLQQEIEKKQVNDDKEKYNKAHVIRFDASEYEDQEKIWFSLLQAFYVKFGEELGVKSKAIYMMDNIYRKVKENPIISIFNFILIIISIIWVTGVYKNTLNFIPKNIAFSILGIISTLTAIKSVVFPSIKKVYNLFKPINKFEWQDIVFPDYTKQLGTRESVKDSLNRLLSIWLRKEEKVVLIIDELDRCSNKTIVEFFKALQLFIKFDSIVSVISINKEAVCYALANDNSHFFEKVPSNEEKIKFGMEYLQKYINIPFFLPDQDDYNKYINQFLQPNTSNAEDEYFSTEERESIKKCIAHVNEKNKLTPRDVKRIINILILSKEHLEYLNKLDNKHHVLFTEYIKWIFYTIFHKEAASIIIEVINTNFTYYQYSYMNQLISMLNEEKYKDYSSEFNSPLFKMLLDIQVEHIIISNKVAHRFLKDMS